MQFRWDHVSLIRDDTGAPMTQHIDSPLSVVRSVIPSLEGTRILDVRCGAGGLAKILAAEGAHVTGIDPNPQAVLDARKLVPAASFEQASAEALPFEDGAFALVERAASRSA